MKKQKDEDLLAEMRKRFKVAVDAESELRHSMLRELRFGRLGEQWDQDILEARKNQPCLTINKLPTYVAQVTGEQRQNKPSIKIRPVDDTSDPTIAEIYTGLIKNIESVSSADNARDYASQYAAYCGFGAYRVLTAYSDDDAFDQDIQIKTIHNPFAVLCDPAAKEVDRSDARYWFICDSLDEEEYKERYPGKEMADWDALGIEQKTLWYLSDSKSVRVVEYFRKVAVDKEIYLLSTGETVEEIPEGVSTQSPPEPGLPTEGSVEPAGEQLPPYAESPVHVVRSRKVKTHKIEWYKASGLEILERQDWAGRYFPIIPVIGDEMWIEEKRDTKGLIRDSMDAVKAYNYARSSHVETVALNPKQPYIATPSNIKGFERMWYNAHKENYPILIANPDETTGGLPQRQAPPGQSTAWVTELQLADSEIRDTIGLFKANIGQEEGNQSGRAILALQKKGDIGVFVFQDNRMKALEYEGKVLLDLIPRIYDADRVIRIMGEDGKSKPIRINHSFTDENGNKVLLNDLSYGKYDAVVTAGPSYVTQRLEAADAILQFMQAYPPAAPVLGDILAEMMDWPQSDKITRRLKAILPPEIAAADEMAELKEAGAEPEMTLNGIKQMIVQIVQEMLGQFAQQTGAGKGQEPENPVASQIDLATKEAKLHGAQLANLQKTHELEGRDKELEELRIMKDLVVETGRKMRAGSR